METFFHGLLGTLDITGDFNLKIALGILLLTIIGEANLHVPLLMESVWLVMGYQAGTSSSAIADLVVLFLIAQSGRQIGMSAIYYIFESVNAPLSRLFARSLGSNRYYKKYAQHKYLTSVEFLSVPSATLGMMTPLNGPIKVILVVKRKLKTLLVSTLLSGMTFDATYIVMGGVFHITSLSLNYLPTCLLIGFLMFMFMKVKLLK